MFWSQFWVDSEVCTTEMNSDWRKGRKPYIYVASREKREKIFSTSILNVSFQTGLSVFFLDLLRFTLSLVWRTYNTTNGSALPMRSVFFMFLPSISFTSSSPIGWSSKKLQISQSRHNLNDWVQHKRMPSTSYGFISNHHIIPGKKNISSHHLRELHTWSHQAS